MKDSGPAFAGPLFLLFSAFFFGGVAVLQGFLKRCGAGCGVFVVRSW
jgi:hypothetical protein